MEQKTKYSDVVASIVEDKKYFSDALDWYFLKYYNTVTDRTFFILLSFFSCAILLFLYMTIKSILPLKESFPVLVKQESTAFLIPKISKVKPDGLKYTSSEAILRLLLINFTREIFTHDYEKGNIEDLNNKLARVKLYTTGDLFVSINNDFNALVEKMFNKNIKQTVTIKSFKFMEQDTFLTKYFSNKTHTRAQVVCNIDVYANNELYSRNEKTILLNFTFNPIKYNVIKKEFSKPYLIINNYDIVNDKQIQVQQNIK